MITCFSIKGICMFFLGLVPFYVFKKKRKKDTSSLKILLRKPYLKKRVVLLLLVYPSTS